MFRIKATLLGFLFSIGQMYEKGEYGKQKVLEEKTKIVKILLQEDIDITMFVKAVGFTEEDLLCLRDTTATVWKIFKNATDHTGHTTSIK